MTLKINLRAVSVENRCWRLSSMRHPESFSYVFSIVMMRELYNI